MSEAVTILTSGVGLGIYVPALLNQRDLRAAGYEADLEVLEGFYSASQLARHLAHRDAFRENFKLALIANRMPMGVQDGLDEGSLEALLERWASARRRRFIVWSGFWLPLLQRYQARLPELPIAVDLCRIDAVVSASFRNQPRPENARDIWLWNWAEKRLAWHIPVLSEEREPEPYEARAERLVIHGGGWAIGTFTQVLPELARSRYAIDLLAPGAFDWPERRPDDRHFAPDPSWHTWQRDARGEFAFPPLGERRGAALRWLPNEHFPPAHALVRQARAIVSKPGGGTLIDSLAAATPVVLLEPYGEAEARSGALWEELGFGIRYERWRDAGFDPAVLARLQRNLLAVEPRRALPQYPREGMA